MRKQNAFEDLLLLNVFDLVLLRLKTPLYLNQASFQLNLCL